MNFYFPIPMFFQRFFPDNKKELELAKKESRILCMDEIITFLEKEEGAGVGIKEARIKLEDKILEEFKTYP